MPVTADRIRRLVPNRDVPSASPLNLRLSPYTTFLITQTNTYTERAQRAGMIDGEFKFTWMID
jgi:hypothetical protein